MHVLLPTIGSAGDVHPMIGLGETLLERGHRVTVLASPLYERAVRQAGLGFAPLGTEQEARALMSNPDLFHPQRGFRTIARHAILPAVRPLYDYIIQQDPADTVIAAQSMAFGARLAQERYGFHVATLHLQPSMIRSVHEAPITGVAIPEWLPKAMKAAWWRFVDSAIVDRELGPGLNHIREEIGLPPVSRLFQEWIHSPERVIGLFPEWFAPPQPDWPPQTRVTGFMLYNSDATGSLSDEAERFLRAGEAPIIFTFGSAMQHAGPFFDAAAAAIKQMGRRAVFVTPEMGQLPASLPPSILHVPYAPFSQLLPRAALLVHHGGIGTSAQALAAGIPHVVTPFSHDQPDNARRLERLGVARSLSPARLQPRTLTAAINCLLASREVRARCLMLAQRVNGPKARKDTAVLIEQLL